MPYNYLTYLLLVALVSACNQKRDHTQKFNVNQKNDDLLFAKRFSLKHHKSYKCVYLFGNRHTQDTTAKFVLANDTAGLAQKNRDCVIIKTPVNKVAALGSLYANMLDALGALDNLIAVDDMHYIGNANIIKKHQHAALAELALSPQIDLEKTLRLQPQIIFSFGMGEGEKDVDQKLRLSQIPNCVIVDHLEENPLARAEWIKLIAAFINKDSLANVLFDSTQKKYKRLQILAATAKNKPGVFTEAKFGDVWYMPGGTSFMATLLKDAGANYLWQDNLSVGSIPLSFEQVYVKAKDADVWINPSYYKTSADMLHAENRYANFKAFKTGKVYNNNLHLNQYGYSNYWEEGLLFPDRILSDLIQVFHPELKMIEHTGFYYYKHLN
ncbi:MAG: ABC transporter substrate-binding protein [Bacteroidota bacterium]